MEAYGATRKMTGGLQNEDAWLILREPCLIVALADGSGSAHFVAKKALRFLERLLRVEPLENLCRFSTWETAFRNVDSYLAGSGFETTLIAGAFIGEGIYGASCGDSRAYLVHPRDAYLNSIANDGKPRIGSGEASIKPLHAKFPEDAIVLFESDGAWTQIDRLSIQRALRMQTHFSDVPSLLLSHANKRGCADDMTVVAVRR